MYCLPNLALVLISLYSKNASDNIAPEASKSFLKTPLILSCSATWEA
ncbi:MAG: hypothetical protein RBT22_12330 [Aliarcobacter sp.]|jgi:hypothetical protein|nr:hypothetical protein [Aliarcobacter sp.]